MAQRFGRYWLHEKIGHGGMAEIFRATIGPDPQTFAFEIAVKRLHPELQRDKSIVDMFLTEADVAKLLRHPNIVQVFESGVVDGQTYIAMEHIWGTDLATLGETLRKKRLRFPPELTVHVGLQVLRALDYVHRASTAAGEPMDIVHRDVTPSNVYVTLDGQVKLGDFGIARVSFLEERDDPMLKGKVAYMPPEVLRGAPVDQRLDLWSLAVTLWEMLTSRRLYEGVPEHDILRGRRLPPIPPAHEVDADVPPQLSLLLARALSPRPRQRPRSAVDLYHDLKLYQRARGGLADGPTLARFVAAALGRTPPAEPAVAQRPSTGVFERPGYQVPVGMSPTQRFELVHRRRRVVWPVVAAAAVVGGLGGGLGARQLLKGRRQPPAVVAAEAATAPVPPPAAAAAPAPAPAPAPKTASPAAAATAPAAPRARPGEAGVVFADDSGGNGRVPAKVDALMQRGRKEAKRQKYAQAEATFREVLALRAKHVPAMLGRADALLELERYAEAEKLVRTALELASESAPAYLLLGDVLWVEGRDQDARDAYQRCIDVDPKSRSAQTARRILARL